MSEEETIEEETGSGEQPKATLEVDVGALIEEREKLRDQLLRTAADFDNFRKRTRRDLEDVRRRAKEEAIREILPIIDNLERAVAASGAAVDVQAVADGVRMVLRGFQDISERMGLERIDAVGSQFDPNIHDAVQQIETTEHPAGTIMAEVVPGYLLQSKLLRPAMVVVARPKPGVPEPVAEEHELRLDTPDESEE